MSKYRLKDYQVIAVRVPPVDSFPEFPDEFAVAIENQTVRPVYQNEALVYFEVDTGGRTNIAQSGDWLVFESDGTVYSVRDEEFRKKYEQISDDGTRIPPYTN